MTALFLGVYMFKKRGFTDKLYWMNLRFAWIFTILCLLLNVFSGKLGVYDLSAIVYGLPLVWAEVGFHTKWIIEKAEKENRRKFGLGTNGKTESEEEEWIG